MKILPVSNSFMQKKQNIANTVDITINPKVNTTNLNSPNAHYNKISFKSKERKIILSAKFDDKDVKETVQKFVTETAEPFLKKYKPALLESNALRKEIGHELELFYKYPVRPEFDAKKLTVLDDMGLGDFAQFMKNQKEIEYLKYKTTWDFSNDICKNLAKLIESNKIFETPEEYKGIQKNYDKMVRDIKNGLGNANWDTKNDLKCIADRRDAMGGAAAAAKNALEYYNKVSKETEKLKHHLKGKSSYSVVRTEFKDGYTSMQTNGIANQELINTYIDLKYKNGEKTKRNITNFIIIYINAAKDLKDARKTFQKNRIKGNYTRRYASEMFKESQNLIDRHINRFKKENESFNPSPEIQENLKKQVEEQNQAINELWFELEKSKKEHLEKN